MSLLIKILLLVVIALLLSLLGIGGRGRGRIAFPGPRIPHSWITLFWLVASLVSYAGAVWFLISGLRESSQDDIGTGFALAFLGAIMMGRWSHLRKSAL